MRFLNGAAARKKEHGFFMTVNATTVRVDTANFGNPPGISALFANEVLLLRLATVGNSCLHKVA